MPSLYKQQIVHVCIKGITLSNLRQRSLGRLTDTYVVISVETQQTHTITTPVVSNSLNPEWRFDEPLRIAVYPSSTIRFTVYRQRRTNIVGSKYMGVLEAPLFTYIDDVDTVHRLNTRDCITSETGNIRVHLEVDTSLIRYGSLDYAEDKIQFVENAYGRESGTRFMNGGAVLRQAMVALDQLVDVVDGIAEIHPWCKTAWALLSCVTKAIRYQHEQDRIVRELIDELEQTLAYTRECRDIQQIPGTTDVIKALARLVAEGATLIDGYMRHTNPTKVLATFSGEIDRIKQCQGKLQSLQTKLQWHLAIRTYQCVQRESSLHASRDDHTDKHTSAYPTPPPSATEPCPASSFIPQPPVLTCSRSPPPSHPAGCYIPPSPASPCHDLPPQHYPAPTYYFPPIPLTAPPEPFAGLAERPPADHWCCVQQSAARHNSEPSKSNQEPTRRLNHRASRMVRATSWSAPSAGRNGS